MQPLVWGSPCVDDFIGVETAWSTVPKTVQGCPPERGSPSGGSTATMTTSGWCAQGSGVWGLGGGHRGASRCQCLPMKAIQDHARFSLVAWREEVPKTLSSFQPPRYAIPSTAIEQRASPLSSRNTLFKPTLLPLFSLRSLLALAIGNSMHRYTATPLDCPDPKTAATS